MLVLPSDRDRERSACLWACQLLRNNPRTPLLNKMFPCPVPGPRPHRPLTVPAYNLLHLEVLGLHLLVGWEESGHGSWCSRVVFAGHPGEKNKTIITWNWTATCRWRPASHYPVYTPGINTPTSSLSLAESPVQNMRIRQENWLAKVRRKSEEEVDFQNGLKLLLSWSSIDPSRITFTIS